jgi:hypothetical protein
MKANNFPTGFLAKYRTAQGERQYVKLDFGHLRLEYDIEETPSLLYLVSFVVSEDNEARAIGRRLELNLDPDGIMETVTCMTEMGVSGLQWSDGHVYWGHTYEDDGPPDPGKEIELGEWVDECIHKMINPSQEDIDALKQ